MKYLHTMLRVSDIKSSINFYCGALGLLEVRRVEVEQGRFTLIFLAAKGDELSQIELTYNWDGDDLGPGSRNFGHLAYHVEDIYETCSRLKDSGVTINRPPRDGYMAFVKSPDNVSIELLQKGSPLEPAEPWVSMENVGEW
ncbi:MAG TPA: lactoylglutathione lyase [Gammaproteobacteria bacterium]|jgi:lactoylglutathione lyase|nr:lactoylglutathione lyase [Gammaproteobacteria bacterium]